MEEEIAREHARSKLLLASLSSILIGLDSEERVVYWNRLAKETLGVDEGKVINCSLSECKIPWQTARVLEAIGTCRKKKGSVRLDDVTFRRPNGEEGFLGFTVIFLDRDPAASMAFLLFGSDITERKRAGEELARREKAMVSLLENLQESQRKLEAQQKALEEANKRLQELSALKDEFVANVSHELRTPLTAVKEGVSLMQDEVLGAINPEQRDFLQTVAENIDRLSELIVNLLDLSKIEAGRLRLVRRKARIEPLIETTLKNYASIASRRTLKTDFFPVPEVFADPDRVLQILGNLFSNALKCTEEDGTICFSLSEEKGFVAVSIQDDGRGIAREDLAKLFQKFSQVGEETARRRGTGLGLSLCKKLVDLHKGTISVHSQVGRGSTFTFTLPVYTHERALEEALEEAREFAKRSGEEKVGLITFNCESLLVGLSSRPETGEREGEGVRGSGLDRVADLIRRNVHGTDVVLAIEPRWVVFLGLAGAGGFRPMVRRIQKLLAERSEELVGRRLDSGAGTGVAIYPEEGQDVHLLFEKATSRALQGVA